MKCLHCSYFKKGYDSDSGTCRRYPKYESHHEENWCGEFCGKKRPIYLSDIEGTLCRIETELENIKDKL